MNLAEYLIKERGRQEDLCRKIGAYPPDMSRWAKGRRPVPFHYCLPIEQATSGQVTRQDLRPKDYHLIWPELQKEAV